MATSMAPRERGERDGHADAIAAWIGTTWKRADRYLPGNHLDRLEYLEGYQSTFRAYTRSMAEGITAELEAAR